MITLIKPKYVIYLIIFILVILGIILSIDKVKSYFKKEEYTFNTKGTAVVKQLKSLNRLETAVFTIEKVIEGGNNTNNAFSDILFGDKILLIANGQVIAGFDLSNIDNSNISILESSITLTLEKPQILVTSLDNGKTRVYDRRQGIFTKGNKDLESMARLRAEESIRKAACEAGIYQVASENARKQLTALLKTLTFENANIIIPDASCV